MIDWTKPIEIVFDDGKIEPAELTGEEMGTCYQVRGSTNPWWAEKDDGRIIPCNYFVRNRAEPKAVKPEIAYATEEQPTLRDRFAMAALASIVDKQPDYAAEYAYRIAAAMMAARNA